MRRTVRCFMNGLLACLALLISGGLAAGQPPAAGKPEDVAKAEALFREGKTDDAWKALQEAAKKNPQLPPARLMLARLYFLANQPGPGRVALEQAAAEAPDHPEIYLTNANQALADGRLTDAVLSCQIALGQANAERWTADQKKAIRREARAGLAAAFEGRQDWDSAKTQLLAWLEFEPKNGTARQRLARAHLMVGRDQEAFNELQQAQKDDSALDPAEIAMGRLYMLKGDAKQAEEWLQKAVLKYARDARAHRAFGGWLLDRGRVEAAKVHIDTAVKLEPKSRETQGLQGLLARYLRDMPTAVRIFEEIVRDEPGNFYASNHLALACAETKETQARAVQIAEVNARQYPRLAEALATLGWVYLRSGRIDEAERLLSASASGGQVTSDMAYYLSRLFQERGKLKEARDLLKSALANDGPFVNRSEAQKLFDEIVKKVPEAPKPK